MPLLPLPPPPPPEPVALLPPPPPPPPRMPAPPPPPAPLVTGGGPTPAGPAPVGAAGAGSRPLAAEADEELCLASGAGVDCVDVSPATAGNGAVACAAGRAICLDEQLGHASRNVI